MMLDSAPGLSRSSYLPSPFNRASSIEARSASNLLVKKLFRVVSQTVVFGTLLSPTPNRGECWYPLALAAGEEIFTRFDERSEHGLRLVISGMEQFSRVVGKKAVSPVCHKRSDYRRSRSGKKNSINSNHI